MCGIAGFVDYVSQPKRKTLLPMITSIKYRGPDSAGAYIDKHIALGIRRLSIIDLKTGDQPIQNEDRTVTVVFNGEIYNYQELRESLIIKGHRFKTRSDTETLVHLYEEYGRETPKFLNGMFAFAIWDKKNQKLLLARDQSGIKPLFYSPQGVSIIFGSEIKALLEHPKPKRVIDHESLELYKAFGYFPGEKSIYQGIYKLPAGSFLEMSRNGYTIHKYWTVKENNFSSDLTLEELLKDSVQRQSVADVPWGVFLSGGIDSSLITYFLTKSQRKVKTFAIGFSDSLFDESGYARQVAKLLHTEHHEETFSANDVQELFSKITAKLDEPLADPSLFPTFKLCQMTKKHVKVALSGDGGDELFGGYPLYQGHLYAAYLRYLPEQFQNVAPSLARIFPLTFGKYNKQEVYKIFFEGINYPPLLRQLAWTTLFYTGRLPKNFPQLLESKWFREVAKEISPKLPSNLKAQIFDYLTFLRDDMLVKVDQASMFNSLEIRVPFLEPRIIQQAFSGKYNHVDYLKTKKLLRKIALGKLPSEIVNRQKKGFGIPLETWLRGELKDFVADQINHRGLADYFSKKEVNGLWKPHQDGVQDNSRYLWLIAMFSAWLTSRFSG